MRDGTGGRRRAKKQVFAFVVGLLVSKALLAEVPSTELGQIEVTVLRSDESVENITRPVVVKDQDQLYQIQADSVAEVLSYEPNIQISGGSRANNQGINIRGLEGNRVIQTVDGVRQNFESGHRPTYFLDPVLIKQIEVLKGPGSSLWGSGAIGGVVAQETVDANDILNAEQQTGGLIKHAYNDNGEGNTTTVAVGARTDSVDVLASFYYRDTNDFEQGNGEDLLNSAARNHGALLKGEWQIADAHTLSVNYRDAETDETVPNNGAAAPSTSNFVIDRKVTSSQLSAMYEYNPASALVDARALVYRNETKAGESRVTDGRSDTTELKTVGMNLNNRSVFTGFDLLYGVDYYRDDFNVSRGGTSRPIPPEAETNVGGAFIRSGLMLTEVLTTELGLRYDYFETEAKNLNNERDDDAVSISAALIWKADSWLEIAFRYDEAFRAPGSEELYTTGTHFCMGPPPCNTFVSDPTLEAEKASNKEIFAKMNWKGVLDDSDALFVTTSIFRNDVDNFIEQTVNIFVPAFPGTTWWSNVDEATLKGMEINARYQVNDVSVKLGYGYTEGEDKKTGEALSGIPAAKLTADIAYGFVQNTLKAGVRYIAAGRQDDVPSDDPNGHYDAYCVTDLYASWSPAALKRDLVIDLSVNNITDKYYRVAFQELYEPGREIRLAATYRF